MKKKNYAIALLRWIIALVFIFSGFVKEVDPWGTAIKLREYYAAFGVSWLNGSEYVASILLSSGEMVLGFCLLFRILERGAVLWVTVLSAGFTLLTLVLALWVPVADCGCFGDVIKLSPWQSFIKSGVLLFVSVVVMRATRKHVTPSEKNNARLIEWSMVFFFFLFAAGVGMYSLRHLPLIDFLPFRVGVNIPSQLDSESGIKSTTLLYKDRTTGQNREFALTDTTWYDTLRWEYVDTRIIEHPRRHTPSIESFALFDTLSDRAPELLASEGELFLITLSRPEEPLPTDCRKRLEDLVDYARQRHYTVICVAPTTLSANRTFLLDDAAPLPIYQMDGTTLKMLIRAHTGVVLLKQGTILGKWNCRDLPLFGEQYPERTPLEVVLERQELQNQMWLLGVFIATFILIYTIYKKHSDRGV